MARITVPTLALAAALLCGCAGDEESASPTPQERPGIVQPPTPVLGLDVRYVDEHGEFQTLRVEDFPR